jgi:hypothetical protein
MYIDKSMEYVSLYLLAFSVRYTMGNKMLGSHNFCYVRWIYRCPRRNVPDFGRVFLMVKYTDITQNTYVES